MLYLEEDVDATRFFYAYKKKTGKELKYNRIHHGDTSPIRSYLGSIPSDLLEKEVKNEAIR